MAKDHYIPASLIGRFSPDENDRRRLRKIWALERGSKDAQNVRAKSIASLQSFYDLYMQQNAAHSRLVDDSWRHYESRLPDVLNEIEKNRGSYDLDAHTWLTVLVPYVTSLFVRGPDFNLRYEAREGVKEIYDYISKKDPNYPKDNTNMARLMEFQRLLAPIMAARWNVLHTTKASPFVINDRGYTFYGRGGKEIQGWFMPVGRTLAFAIEPISVNRCRVLVVDKGLACWKAVMNHNDVSANDVNNFNRAIAGVASNFIVGPTEESVMNLSTELENEPIPPEYVYYNSPSPAVLRKHELAWHYLLSKIKLAAIDKQLTQELRPPNSFILSGQSISFCLTAKQKRPSV